MTHSKLWKDTATNVWIVPFFIKKKTSHFGTNIFFPEAIHSWMLKVGNFSPPLYSRSLWQGDLLYQLTCKHWKLSVFMSNNHFCRASEKQSSRCSKIWGAGASWNQYTFSSLVSAKGDSQAAFLTLSHSKEDEKQLQSDLCLVMPAHINSLIWFEMLWQQPRPTSNKDLKTRDVDGKILWLMASAVCG